MKFLDTLSVRYGCPFFILDEFIQLGQLQEFLKDITQIIYEEKEERVKWEVYLHKVFNQTYRDFIDGIERTKQNENVTDEELVNITKSSRNIMSGFTFE